MLFSNPLTLIGVEKTPTPCVKKPKTAKTFSQKSAEIFQSVGEMIALFLSMILMLMAAIYLKLFCS
jgi:hypothetical protein